MASSLRDDNCVGLRGGVGSTATAVAHADVSVGQSTGCDSRDGSRWVLEPCERRPLNHATTSATPHRKLRSCTSFQISVALLALSISLQLAFLAPSATAQEDDPSTPEWKAANNPLNQFCGISYDEAMQFCHLEPSKSLPCPNGAETDCPYSMPCWEIAESCTGAPSPAPTPAPMTARSSNPEDHNFCGLGFDNLFGCSYRCPNGSPAECPEGQLCYFDTVCDARIEGMLLGDPTRKPTPAPTQSPTITPKPTDFVDTGLPDGRNNFCGESFEDARDNCSRDRHCPKGSNDECYGEDMFCFANLEACDVNDFPTAKPTISPKPTFRPSYAPTTRSPSWTESPTPSPLDPDDIRGYFFCGNSWGDASSRCYQRCLSGAHVDCPGEEQCFASADCDGLKEDKPAPEPEEPGVTLSPDATPVPSPMPAMTDEPTNSPLEQDDFRNFFYCGISWNDASTRCYKRCVSSLHSDCPAGEECFAQANCKEGVQTIKPTVSPTPMPLAGTLSPTISSVPTNSPTNTRSPTISPAPTNSPVGTPTSSPAVVPTESPTTPFPTNKPTFAPCAGEPCPNKEYCRSNQGFCGPGDAYCNDKSIWIESCGVPTDPPASLSPTTIWPSESPTLSTSPTEPRTSPPTANPIVLSDMIYYLRTEPPATSPPTAPNSPSSEIVNSMADRTNSPVAIMEEENVDEKYYAPDDPAGSFFCGTDWSHAITKCPNRCPSGEADECPKKMSCYAFTPCIGIGINTPPTAKPTWEPTKKPTPEPTAQPTTTVQYWKEQNAQNKPTDDVDTNRPTPKPVWWTPEPTPRPSYSPTMDQCRGKFCDYEGECRSRLGFCGEGIVYCNSASSWVPDCGGGGTLIQLEETSSPNKKPTPSPVSAWEAWVETRNDENNATVAEGGDSSGGRGEDPTGSGDSSVADETSSEEDDEEEGEEGEEGEEEEEGRSSGSSGYGAEALENWGSQGQGQGQQPSDISDLRWWTLDKDNSSNPRTVSLLVAAVSLATPHLLWQIIFT